MGIFDQFYGGSDKKEIAAEHRQREYVREQQAYNTAHDAANEQLYYESQKQRSDLLKWQQDLGDELLELVMTLQAYKKVGNDWVPIKDKEPLCNEKFIYDVVIPQCKPFLSRNMINTNFDNKTILSDLKYTCNEIADNMTDGYDIYGIKFINQDLILRQIKNVIKAGVYRALNGWTKKTDSTVTKRVEALTENTQERKGLFDIGG